MLGVLNAKLPVILKKCILFNLFSKVLLFLIPFLYIILIKNIKKILSKSIRYKSFIFLTLSNLF